MNDFVKPSIEYAQIAPLLVIFGVAIVGVVLEAFLPRPYRLLAQMTLTIGGLVLAIATTVTVALGLDKLGGGVAAAGWPDGRPRRRRPYRLPLAGDPRAGADRFAAVRRASARGGVTAFAGQASALPGTEAERLASAKGEHRGLPALLFAIGGMISSRHPTT